jgi:hypothetical protein
MWNRLAYNKGCTAPHCPLCRFFPLFGAKTIAKVPKSGETIETIAKVPKKWKMPAKNKRSVRVREVFEKSSLRVYRCNQLETVWSIHIRYKELTAFHTDSVPVSEVITNCITSLN